MGKKTPASSSSAQKKNFDVPQKIPGQELTADIDAVISALKTKSPALRFLSDGISAVKNEEKTEHNSLCEYCNRRPPEVVDHDGMPLFKINDCGHVVGYDCLISTLTQQEAERLKDMYTNYIGCENHLYQIKVVKQSMEEMRKVFELQQSLKKFESHLNAWTTTLDEIAIETFYGGEELHQAMLTATEKVTERMAALAQRMGA